MLTGVRRFKGDGVTSGVVGSSPNRVRPYVGGSPRVEVLVVSPGVLGGTPGGVRLSSRWESSRGVSSCPAPGKCSPGLKEEGS